MSMIGKSLAHYEITGQIGKGGMGEVYQAKDTKLGRDVAIKILPEEFALDPNRVARFQREAKLLASLNHPNIAAIYGLEESESIHFLVMELISGDTLSDRIKKGPIPVEEALKFALQIAEALEAAHERGVIHRDLKPANIKVTPEGKVKVLDFGLAKAFAGDETDLNLTDSPTLSEAATQQGIILGTAAYMSPEQARGKPVDKRVDIWAFGVVLYEILTGKALFLGEDITSTLARVLERKPDFSSLPTDIHPRILLLLERCLEKDIRNRYSSMNDPRVDIQKALIDPSGVSVSFDAEEGSKTKTGFMWLAVSIIMTALISGGTAWMLKKPPLPDPGKVIRFNYELPEGQKFNPGPTGTYSLAISPDGTQFVYGTKEGLYLRSMDQVGTRLIGGTDGNSMGASFSPDGEWIVYCDSREAKLKKISKSGGVPVDLCSADGFIYPFISWTSEDTILFSDLPDGGAKRISPSKGVPETLIKCNPENLTELGNPLFPQILPGETHILYTQLRGSGIEKSRIVVRSSESGEEKVLFTGAIAGRYLSTGHIIYVSSDKDSNNIYAVPFDLKKLETTGGPVPMVQNQSMSAISESGTLLYIPGNMTYFRRTLVWVDKAGYETPIPAEPYLYSYFRISPDGTKAAFTVDTGTGSDIYIFNFSSEVLTRLTFDEARDSDPLWTLDSRRIAFHSRREGTLGGVYLKNADGTGGIEHLVTTPNRNTYPLSWSSDGNILVTEEFSSSPPDGDIGIVVMGDHPERRLLFYGKYIEAFPQISPDGHWIAYVSNRLGQTEVFVNTFPDVDKGKWQISRKGGSSPRWSPDSKTLYYRNQDEVLSVSIDVDESFKAGKPELLFKGDYFSPINPMLEYQTWDISPDGERFLMIKQDFSGDDASGDEKPQQINVVVNWFEELKERVPVE